MGLVVEEKGRGASVRMRKKKRKNRKSHATELPLPPIVLHPDTSGNGARDLAWWVERRLLPWLVARDGRAKGWNFAGYEDIAREAKEGVEKNVKQKGGEERKNRMEDIYGSEVCIYV